MVGLWVVWWVMVEWWLVVLIVDQQLVEQYVVEVGEVGYVGLLVGGVQYQFDCIEYDYEGVCFYWNWWEQQYYLLVWEQYVVGQQQVEYVIGCVQYCGWVFYYYVNYQLVQFGVDYVDQVIGEELFFILGLFQWCVEYEQCEYVEEQVVYVVMQEVVGQQLLGLEIVVW